MSGKRGYIGTIQTAIYKPPCYKACVKSLHANSPALPALDPVEHPGEGLGYSCNPNNLQFYGLYLLLKGYLLKGYLLLNFRLLEPQVGFRAECGQHLGIAAVQ